MVPTKLDLVELRGDGLLKGAVRLNRTAPARFRKSQILVHRHGDQNATPAMQEQDGLEIPRVTKGAPRPLTRPRHLSVREDLNEAAMAG